MNQQLQQRFADSLNRYGKTVDADLVRKIFREETELMKRDQLNNALYNPKTQKIYLEDPDHKPKKKAGEAEPDIPWDSYDWLVDNKKFKELKVQYLSNSISKDKMDYDFINPHYHEMFDNAKATAEDLSAGIIYSTDFPAVTVTSVQQALVNRSELNRVKYNLLNIFPVQNTDKLRVIFPEYDDTTRAVKVGYRENDPIDTIEAGGFTQTSITMDKAGAGIGFTEEFYMTEFTFPIEATLMDKIAFDFTAVRHDRLLALLPSFPDIAGLDWAAYSPGDMQSTNRPMLDMNAAYQAIIAFPNREAVPDTMITNLKQWTDLDMNSWSRGFGQPDSSNGRALNGLVTNPKGIPWIRNWFINEDIPANTAYIFDSDAGVRLEGPRKTTQAQLVNPDQTVIFQKEWFKNHLRKTGWGRELTGI